MARKRRKINDELSAKIKLLYADRIIVTDIAKLTGVSRASVYNTLSDVVERRKKYMKYTPELRKEMVRLYKEQKLSCREVAEKLGVTKSIVERTVVVAKSVRSKTQARKAYHEKRGDGAMNVIIFTCKVCGKVEPLSRLTENRRFRPTIYCCMDCAN